MASTILPSGNLPSLILFRGLSWLRSHLCLRHRKSYPKLRHCNFSKHSKFLQNNSLVYQSFVLTLFRADCRLCNTTHSCNEALPGTFQPQLALGRGETHVSVHWTFVNFNESTIRWCVLLTIHKRFSDLIQNRRLNLKFKPSWLRRRYGAALIWGRNLNRVQRQQIRIWETRNKCVYQVCKHDIVDVEGGIPSEINPFSENLFHVGRERLNLQHYK